MGFLVEAGYEIRARDDLRRVLIRDQADRNAISSRLKSAAGSQRA